MAENNGFIGDVKYSLLEPGIFLKEHPDWDLLAGQELNSTTPLYQLGVQRLPDARAMFIRGVNLGRTDMYADPDGDNRSINSYQRNAYEAHNHEVGPLPIGHSNIGNNSEHRIVSDDGPSWNNTRIIQEAKIKGDKETRPNNIALYIYVKIK